MKSLSHILIITAIIALTISIPACAQSATTGRTTTTSPTTYTISGHLGVPGAELQGAPGHVYCNEQGNYHFTVPQGWSGTIIPVQEGFTFNPPSRTYSDVTQDMVRQNYSVPGSSSRRSPQPVTRTVARTPVNIIISGNVGLAGVQLTGAPIPVVSAPDGTYSIIVPDSWSGTIKPQKEGYEFAPPARVYSPVTRNYESQNFTAGVIDFTISGNADWPGVIMTGLPGNPVTDDNGNYSSEVPYRWSGTVTPQAPREITIRFEPSSRTYSTVLDDQLNQDYNIMSARQNPQAVLPTLTTDQMSINIIPTTGIERQQYDQIEEDLQVMLHILNNKTYRPNEIIGTPLRNYGDIFASPGSNPQSIYIQGFGALFMISVNYPIIPGPQLLPENPDQIQQPQDPMWQQARENLFSTSAPNRNQYVTLDTFQQILAETLKSASNIRNIAPNELVVINVTCQAEIRVPVTAQYNNEYYSRIESTPETVSTSGRIGTTGSGRTTTTTQRSRTSAPVTSETQTRSYNTGSTFPVAQQPVLPTTSGRVPRRAPASTMTLRPYSAEITVQATKADIDAFANGDINFKEFFETRMKAFQH